MDRERLILLKRTKYGEADLILRGLNPEGSKVHLFARSALKSKKRFGGGVLEPLHFVEVVYQRKKNQDDDKLRSISEANLIRDFASVRADYARLQVGLFFLKTMDEWSREGVPDGQALFNLLGQSLKALEVQKNLQTLRLQFLTKLMWIQGVLEATEEFHEFLSRPIRESDEIQISLENADRLERRLIQLKMP